MRRVRRAVRSGCMVDLFADADMFGNALNFSIKLFARSTLSAYAANIEA